MLTYWVIGAFEVVFFLLFLVWLVIRDPRLGQLLHRASSLVCVAFLCAIPIGIIAEVAEWGGMPDRFELGFFCNAWVFAIIAYLTRPAKPSMPNSD